MKARAGTGELLLLCSLSKESHRASRGEGKQALLLLGEAQYVFSRERRYHPTSQNFRKESQKDMALGQKAWVPCCLAPILLCDPGKVTTLL